MFFKNHNFVSSLLFCMLSIPIITTKPTLEFVIPAFEHVAQFLKPLPQSMKVYTKNRVQSDSMRMVFKHEFTVAVVERGLKNKLLNCELLLIHDPNQVFDVLGELKETARPVAISLEEMLTLMKQCQQLADSVILSKHEETRKNNTVTHMEGRGIKNPFTLLSGIIPGTKWCGTGDIAKDYFDLGAEASVDICCRAHDLCPVKIRAYSNRYNLTNNSLYTKSHCICDDILFDCLKMGQTNTAQFMGNVYFNLVQVPCIEETKTGRRFRNSRNNF